MAETGWEPEEKPHESIESEPVSEPDDARDPGADTGRFQAFVAEGEDEPAPSPRRFRVASLVAGLVVFAAIVVVLVFAT